MADVMEQLAEAAKNLKEAAALSLQMSQSASGAALPLQFARGGSAGAKFGSIDSQFHFEQLGQVGSNVAARKAFNAQGDAEMSRRASAQSPDYAGGRQAMDAFTKALRHPARALEDLAEAGGRLAPAAAFAAGALRTIGALRGAYGSVQSVMERGNPNMAGQMQGTIDLMANRLAGALSPAIEKLNAGLQGMTDLKPGASIGAGVGGLALPAVGLALLTLMGGPASMATMAAMAVVGLIGGSAIGSWLSGEKAMPSMRGLPQPSMGNNASDFYDQAMMRSLALQPGTLEAELARRQIELLSAQIGILQSIDNTIRGSAPEFR